MRFELKRAILLWLLNNKDTYGLVTACCGQFRAYVYDSDGQYLIGGQEVYQFICDAADLISKSY